MYLEEKNENQKRDFMMTKIFHQGKKLLYLGCVAAWLRCKKETISRKSVEICKIR